MFTFKGLSISRSQLQRIIERVEPERQPRNGDDGDGDARARNGIVSELVLADTLHRYPDCTCEELGLRAGMRASELQPLGAGCKASDTHWETDHNGKRHWVSSPNKGWVCERLLAVRRAYGR